MKMIIRPASSEMARLSDFARQTVSRRKPGVLACVLLPVLILAASGCSNLPGLQPGPQTEIPEDPLQYFGWVSHLDAEAVQREQQRLTDLISDLGAGDACVSDCINLALALTATDAGAASETDQALMLLERARNEAGSDPEDAYANFAALWQQHLLTFRKAGAIDSVSAVQESSIDFMRHQIKGLQSQIAEKDEKIAALDSQLEGRQSQVALLQKQIVALQTQIEELTRLEQQIIEREDF